MHMGVQSWISLRFGAISVTFMALTCGVCLILRESTDPVVVGLLLSYVITLTDFLLYFVYILG
jgi:hypothetical protein